MPLERPGAKGITFKDNVKPEVASALRRLRQNMAHPDAHELARHLRLAGADPSVISAAKSLSCDTCLRNRRGGHPRPSTLPTILSVNQVVGVDLFSVYDIHGGRRDILYLDMVRDQNPPQCGASLATGHYRETWRCLERNVCSSMR